MKSKSAAQAKLIEQLVFILRHGLLAERKAMRVIIREFYLAVAKRQREKGKAN
jgi:hypothetical protein